MILPRTRKILGLYAKANKISKILPRRTDKSWISCQDDQDKGELGFLAKTNKINLGLLAKANKISKTLPRRTRSCLAKANKINLGFLPRRTRFPRFCQDEQDKSWIFCRGEKDFQDLAKANKINLGSSCQGEQDFQDLAKTKKINLGFLAKANKVSKILPKQDKSWIFAKANKISKTLPRRTR